MDVQSRIHRYLGDQNTNTAADQPSVIKHSSISEMERPLMYCYNDFLGKPFPSSKTTYYQDMTRSIHYLPHLYNKKFLFYPHDRVEGFDVPTLVKSRPITGYNKSILFNLNYLRHFADVYKVDGLDVPYEQKKDVLVWRGADTGYGFGNDIPYRPVSRQTLVETYSDYKGDSIDVGLTNLSVNNNMTSKDNTNHPFHKYVKPKVKMQDLLQHKFLLSVEGNDVATNMKWILYSNSVAFCPPFTINSWILEEDLHPWQHYIPVRHDFADLPDKVEWARNHPDQCQDISRQGKEYIGQFLDIQNEKKIMDAILEEYSKFVKIIK